LVEVGTHWIPTPARREPQQQGKSLAGVVLPSLSFSLAPGTLMQ
jgi:hypothetical protein